MGKISKEQLDNVLEKDFAFYSADDSSKNFVKGRVLYLISKELGAEMESQDFKRGTPKRKKIIKEVLRMFVLLLDSFKPGKGIILRPDGDAWLDSDMLSERKDAGTMRAVQLCRRLEIPLYFKGGIICEKFSRAKALSRDIKYLISSSVDDLYGCAILLYGAVNIVLGFPPGPQIYVFTEEESKAKQLLNKMATESNKVLLCDPSNIKALYKNPALFRPS
ncbi:MAG: hypothetical protein V1882_08505 [Candidatus Omnitrophota bacterium]